MSSVAICIGLEEIHSHKAYHENIFVKDYDILLTLNEFISSIDRVFSFFHITIYVSLSKDLCGINIIFTSKLIS